MQGHELHIAVIFIQILGSLTFLYWRKINKNIFVTFLVFIAIGVYTSPSRLVLANHHQSMEPGVYHDCCQPLATTSVDFFELPKEIFANFISSPIEIKSGPFLIDHKTNIRGPPQITS